jgi:hypothetical protein
VSLSGGHIICILRRDEKNSVGKIPMMEHMMDGLHLVKVNLRKQRNMCTLVWPVIHDGETDGSLHGSVDGI